MISPFRMAWLHFSRQRLQSAVLIFSLSLALAAANFLLHLYVLSENRYASMTTNVQAVVGPKSGGIEILLGSLNLEVFDEGLLPLNLFQTLRAGADVKFEDGSVVSSSQLTKKVIPFLMGEKIGNAQIIGTDPSIFSLLQKSEMLSFPAINQALVGASVDLPEEFSLADGTQIHTLAQLPRQNSAYDRAIFIPIEMLWQARLQKNQLHPIWHEKVLSYFLIQIEKTGFVPLQSLINDRTVAQMIWVDREKEKLAEITGSAHRLGAIMVFVILCLSAFSVFGMLSIRAENLRVSAATLQAIGYARHFILRWMSFEALLIGFCSGTIACVLEALAFWGARQSLSQTWIVPSFEAQLWYWPLLIVTQGILFSLLGSFLPTLRLLKVSIHDELKSG